jgi:endonuclease/exonuclease/phosphatase family metal-dependent hydrolase
MTRVRIATWNICGRHVANSPDVAPAGAVKKIMSQCRADVVCLQEVHFYEKKPDAVLLEELQSAGLEYFEGLPLSESHLDASAWLGVGIASAWPLERTVTLQLINPALRKLIRGEEWSLHDKGLLGCRVRTPDGEFLKINSLHLFPFHEFGISAEESYVGKMWSEFWSYADGLVKDCPVVLAGDYNQESRASAAKQWSARDWFSCLDKRATMTSGFAADDVVVSSAPRSVTVTQMSTFSDHDLVLTDISL